MQRPTPRNAQQLDILLANEAQQLELFLSEPATLPRRCGECIWHHDLFGTNEALGFGNCLAMRYPEVEGLLFSRDATCVIPTKFERRGRKQ